MSWRDAPCTDKQCFGILRLLRVLPPTVFSWDDKGRKLADDLVNERFKATKGEASDIMERLHSICVYRSDRYTGADVRELFPEYYDE